MEPREVKELIEKAIRLAILQERKRIADIIEEAGWIENNLDRFAERVVKAVRQEER
jgi:hypothetical protein